jgi:hypothetical protein
MLVYQEYEIDIKPSHASVPFRKIKLHDNKECHKHKIYIYIFIYSQSGLGVFTIFSVTVS